jgi:dihydroorotate dehydrogenase
LNRKFSVGICPARGASVKPSGIARGIAAPAPRGLPSGFLIPRDDLPIPYSILRLPLFGLPPEAAHDAATTILRAAVSAPPARALARGYFRVDAAELRADAWGIDFPNPVGLAAGFDKDASAFNAVDALGFGFVEIGTITAEPQPGNPRPRLFRLPNDDALLNRMGFNNPGAAAVAARLRNARIAPILGINIGKSKVTPLEAAADDYLRSVDLLLPFARYLAINVSSPNTPGLRSLQDAGPLRELLREVVARVRTLSTAGHACPVLVKLAPDLTDPQLDEAVGIAVDEGVSGIIATNTTVSRDGLRTPPGKVNGMGPGGISGAPVRARAVEVVARIHATIGGRVPIIGVGGIFSADDAWRMIRAGASLVQVYTGFVYEGPGLVRRINRGLLARLREEGATSLAQVVGSGVG